MTSTAVLVTGATGRIGRHLVRSLAETDVEVRAMTRNPEQATWLTDEGVESVEGDFDDPDSLDHALAGAEKAFLLSPVLQEMTELQGNFVRAAARSDLDHLVKLSAAGADSESKWDIARWHGRIEAQIAEAGLPYTHLRPVFFMQNLLDAAPILRETGTLARPAPPDTPVNKIDVRDVATVAATVLTEPGHVQTTYKLTGPAPVTLRSVVDAISRATGLDLGYREVPAEEAVLTFVEQGSPAWLAEEQVKLFRGFAKGAGDVATDTAERLLGRPPRSIDEFATDHAHRFLEG